VDLKAFGDWLSSEIGVALHVSFWLAVGVAALLIWRAMEWRYAGIIERLRDERDGLLRRSPTDAASEAEVLKQRRLLEKQNTPQIRPAEGDPPQEKPIRVQMPIRDALASKLAERVPVGEKVTPTFLQNIYREKTKLQADQAAAVYIGKWMTVAGSVHDIQPQRDGTVFVNVDYPSRPIPFSGDIMVVLLVFQHSNARFDVMEIGDSITATGRIRKIERHSIALDYCELAS
jgi:hypothetical protein